MKKKIQTGLFALLAAVFLFSTAIVLHQTYDSWRADRDRADASETAGLAEPDRSSPAQSNLPETPDPPEPLPEEVAHLAEVDLEALREANEDVVGWIEIPGTELSYPLVRGTDNQFYLSHNWKKEASGGGSVFLEETNNRDLTGFHLIAYAHRMRNDTMFGTLKYYKDLEFWQEHPSVYLVDETAVRRYDIFAAHEAPVTSLVYRLALESGGLEEEFLQFCLDNSVIDTGVIPETGAQILTLSTCTGNGHANRWVVQGVLAQRYEFS